MQDPAVSPPPDLLGDAGSNRLVRARHGFMLYSRFDTVVGRSIEYYGEYFESEVVIDVGANIGAHTLALARIVGPTGRVLAFEPVRTIHQVLCANMALNSRWRTSSATMPRLPRGMGASASPTCR